MSADTPTSPKYRRIYSELLIQIQRGDYENGERLPSEFELAEKYSVSRPTVTRALNELRHDGFLVRRSGAGSFVQLNRQDRSSGVHQQFGLLVPRLGEIFEPIANRIAELAHDLDFSLLWLGSSTNDTVSPEMYEQTCRRYLQHGVDGIFLVTMELDPEADQVNQRIMKLLKESNTAIVLIDNDLEMFPQRSTYDLVGIDNARSGYLATRHLLDQTIDRVDFFLMPYSAPTIGSRIRGYQEALRDSHISPDPAWVHTGDPCDLGFVKECIRKGARNIICGNDFTAAELMHSITKLGYSIPQDFRIVGFDDIKYARLARVPLTTFRQPCREIGETAVETMFSRLKKPDRHAITVYLEPELIVRESSRMP